MYSPKSVPHHVTTPTTYILRCLVVVTMIVAAATFLHVNNYRPKQTFLSCDRPCHHLDWPMICRVKLTLEVFQSLSKSCGDCPLNQTACLANHCISADGQRRGILTANRQMPGPSIQVCENDILVVDVINRLPGKAAAVHWRGQTQMEMPYMDGTPLVTQCPIPSYTTFQYKFRASIPGTHLWHAHAGADVTDGIIGSLIVRQADLREPHRALYDIDDPNHVVLVTQWQHSLPEVQFNQGYLKPAILLINGKGRQPNGPAVPLSTFTVIPGRRHRFRVANAGGAGACPVTLFIDGHLLLLIALDGHPIESRQVTSITLAKGERADFVLKASKRIGSYWMNVHTAKECGTSTINGVAMLNYKGNSENPAATAEAVDQRDIDEIGTDRVAVTTNPTEKCGDRENLCAMDIQSIRKIPQTLTKPGTDVTLYLPINYKMQATELIGDGGTETRVLNVNNVTFTFPPSPLLTQGGDVSPGMLCINNEDDLNESNETMSRRRCRQVGDVGADDICECVNVRHVPLGATVEIILLDQGGLNDLVYHLHGYSFYVVGARQFGRSVSLQELKKLDERSQLFSRNLDCALIKDTIVVPKFGAVALRFKADNPGYWMLRDEHATDWTRGLDVILQVGEPSDMVAAPQDFPKCGSFVGPDYFLI